MTTPWTITNIVAATDLSKASVPALRYARLFADAFSAKLTVVYSDRVVYPIDAVGPSSAVFLMPSPEHETRLRRELAQQVEPMMSGGRQYDIELAAGQPIPAILETAAAKNADLIVMGTHLREGGKRALLGSVSNGVLHRSHCPVLTVGGDDIDAVHVTNILCPINFSDVAREALGVAARLAEVFRSRLFIAHVIESGEVKGTVDDEEKVRRWIGPELQASCCYRELVLRGGAAERVLDCIEEVGASLLVVGAQHKRFRDTTVIGATTERLLRFASCPLLVVPRKAVRPEAGKQRDATATAHW